MIEEKIIYRSTVKCPRCWSLNLGEYTAEIVTFIRARKIGCFKFYKVIQGIPLLHDPFYDGEYDTNRNLKAVAALEKAKAKMYISEFKEKLKRKES